MTIPKYLYHYTSQKGLLGILDVGSEKPIPKLWMTSTLYLNDSSEFKYTLELVKSEIKERRNTLVNHFIEMIDNTYRTYGVIEKFCDILPDNTIYDGYIFALSGKKDDLNQWRGYCPEGGFCLEFDYIKLASIINKNSEYIIKKCKYSLEENQNLVKSILDLIPSIFESNQNLSPHDTSLKILHKIIKISSYIKHHSFTDEEEYRIIHQGRDEDKIKYRHGKSMVIPYIEFSPVDDDSKLPISKIWVSPTPHPELSKSSIESFLRTNGYEEIKVEKSEIPYRSL